MRSLLFAVFALALCAGGAIAQVQPTYLYPLAGFSGRLRDDGVRLYVDRERDETYVIYQNLIRVFNQSGMEIFGFGENLDLGQIVDLAVNDDGDILLLSFQNSRPMVTRCNYRGVPIDPIDITGLPEGVVFNPNRMIYRPGVLYFVSLSTSTIVVTDANGVFRKHIDVMSLIDQDERQKSGAEIIGFTVDGEGNIFFTVPALFKVYKLSPDGQLSSFGRAGSAAGRFGVLAGVAIDSQGRVIVADKLKCVVMVFDSAFNFMAEFGYRGARPENLIVPDDVAVDRQDRVYVAQGRKRGISVFALSRN